MIKTNFILCTLLVMILCGMDELSPITNETSTAYNLAQIQKARIQESTIHFEFHLATLKSTKKISYKSYKQIKQLFEEAISKKEEAGSFFFSNLDTLASKKIISNSACKLLKHSWNNSFASIYSNTPPQHDEKKWRKKYEELMENEIGQRKLRAYIYEQTKTACLSGYHYNKEECNILVPPDELVNSQKEMQEGTFVKNNLDSLTSTGKYDETVVKVYKMGSIELGQILVQEGFHPVVLNFANKNHVGGGVIRGALAQEEDLFRRSSYFLGLDNKYNPHLDEQLEGTYLIPEFGAIYTPKVNVIRGPEKDGFPFIPPFNLDFIACAAYNRNIYDSDAPSDEIQYLKGMKEKIRTILRLGVITEHDSIILGAFGCGAFKNDSKVVSQLFKEVIQEPEFAKQYKLIAFAVPGKWAITYQLFYDKLDGLILH